MRSLNYALATEKSYRRWIVEFLRFHRVCGQWQHPVEMGKSRIEMFLTHLAIERKVAAKTQNRRSPPREVQRSVRRLLLRADWLPTSHVPMIRAVVNQGQAD